MGECLICHERPVANAPDAAACGVCMLADLRRVMGERNGAEKENRALRAALQDIVTLCMDVPATEDWRAKVGDKARKALHGEPGWKET